MVYISRSCFRSARHNTGVGDLVQGELPKLPQFQHVGAAMQHCIVNVLSKVSFTENIENEIQPEPRFRGYSMNTLNTDRRPCYRGNRGRSGANLSDTIKLRDPENSQFGAKTWMFI